jgi:soluble lytic murein transglycosylase-like protein
MGLSAALSAGETSSAPVRVTSVVRSDPHSGKLVRSVIVTPRAVGSRQVAGTVVAPRVVAASAVPPEASTVETATGLDQTVEQIAAKHDLPPQLIHSVIKVESNYNPFAVSSKGALGLMQLIPATARRFGVSDVFNPVQNIEGGAKYLRYLLDLYGNDFPLALAAYNAGEGAVAKFGGVPPFLETRNYLTLVRKQLEIRNKTPKAAVAAKPAASSEPAGPAHILELREPDGGVRYVNQ